MTQAPRTFLNKSGSRYTAFPARDFAARVRHHAEKKNAAVLESLLIVQRLRDMAVISPHSIVDGTGAVLQAFSGTKEMQACHTMPCQLTLDGKYLQELTSKVAPLNETYRFRTRELAAQCTRSPRAINSIDKVLEWSTPEFKEKYLNCVRTVLKGQSPNDAYLRFSFQRWNILDPLVREVRKLNFGDDKVSQLDLSWLPKAYPNPKIQDAVRRTLVNEAALSDLQPDGGIIRLVHMTESASA